MHSIRTTTNEANFYPTVPLGLETIISMNEDIEETPRNNKKQVQ